MIRTSVLTALWWCLLACEQATPEPSPVWAPGTVYPSLPAANARGLLDLRGLIHAHSPYSHDACDGEPLIDGLPDPVCMEDLRRGLCQVQHDFAMFTDHDDSGGDTDFMDLLLHEPDRGDVLVSRDGDPVASWAACPEPGKTTLIMAGMEASLMPVGLERHTDRRYDRQPTAEAVEVFKEAGAVVLLQHTEDWTVDQMVDLGVDGFEMFNLHANTVQGANQVLEMLFRVTEGRPGLPHPDLFIVPWISEDPRYLERWSQVLARGVRRVGTMGTDCHRNTFEALLEDGERGDSYRRMMMSFSNHLLVRPEGDGSWDDRHLKEALRAGRLYGVFELLGYAEGFDFVGQGETLAEMGDEVRLGDRVTLSVTQPQVRHLDQEVEMPALRTRLLRATEAGWVEVAAGPGDLRVEVTEPGAYRAEVRMQPRHLLSLIHI